MAILDGSFHDGTRYIRIWGDLWVGKFDQSLSSILHINEGLSSSVWRQLQLQQVMSHFQLPQALGASSQTL